jgi:hypothetical protein
VLGWVNQQRRIHGIGKALAALPLGRRGSSCDCPIARAFTAGPLHCSSSSRVSYLMTGDGLPGRPAAGGIWHPGYVTDFIDAFDVGQIPELDEAAH